VDDGLSYDETIKVLRAALVEVEGNTWAFQVRSRGQPKLLSSHAWRELGEIEALLVESIVEALSCELRAEPWTRFARLRARGRGLLKALAGERGVIERLCREFTHSPVEGWRRATPQLEATVWPFFVARTHYGANTFSLALDQPAPFPPLIWHPGRREFQGR
jgi:hypothetical protein